MSKDTKKDKDKAPSTNNDPTPVSYLTPFPFGRTKNLAKAADAASSASKGSAAVAPVATRQKGSKIYNIPNVNDFFAFRQFADSLDGFKLVYSKNNDCVVWEKKIEGEPFHLIKVFGVFYPGNSDETSTEVASDSERKKQEKKEKEEQKKKEKKEKEEKKKEEKKSKKEKGDKKDNKAKGGESTTPPPEAGKEGDEQKSAKQVEEDDARSANSASSSASHDHNDDAEKDNEAKGDDNNTADGDNAAKKGPETREGHADSETYTPVQLYNVIQDPIYRDEWDKFRLEAHRILLLSQNSDIGYYAAKSPVSIVSNRDFVNQRSWHVAVNGSNNSNNKSDGEPEEEYIIFNSSVPVDNYGEDYQKVKNNNKYGGFVRAISKVTGYLIQPIDFDIDNAATASKSGEAKHVDPNTEKSNNRGVCITYITWSDPRGWIPTSLTNYISSRYAPNTIHTLRAALEKYASYREKVTDGGKKPEERDWILDPPPAVWWTEQQAEEGEKKEVKVECQTREFVKKMWAEENAKKKAKK